jgi:hypothetical protein
MREVSDAFLLMLAEVSGGMLGLFVVGVLFFVESAFRQLEGRERGVVEGYFRARSSTSLPAHGTAESGRPVGLRDN